MYIKQHNFLKMKIFIVKLMQIHRIYKLPTSTINKYKSLKIDELNTLCNEYDITIGQR